MRMWRKLTGMFAIAVLVGCGGDDPTSSGKMLGDRLPLSGTIGVWKFPDASGTDIILELTGNLGNGDAVELELLLVSLKKRDETGDNYLVPHQLDGRYTVGLGPNGKDAWGDVAFIRVAGRRVAGASEATGTVTLAPFEHFPDNKAQGSVDLQVGGTQLLINQPMALETTGFQVFEKTIMTDKRIRQHNKLPDDKDTRLPGFKVIKKDPDDCAHVQVPVTDDVSGQAGFASFSLCKREHLQAPPAIELGDYVTDAEAPLSLRLHGIDVGPHVRVSEYGFRGTLTVTSVEPFNVGSRLDGRQNIQAGPSRLHFPSEFSAYLREYHYVRGQPQRLKPADRLRSSLRHGSQRNHAGPCRLATPAHTPGVATCVTHEACCTKFS